MRRRNSRQTNNSDPYARRSTKWLIATSFKTVQSGSESESIPMLSGSAACGSSRWVSSYCTSWTPRWKVSNSRGRSGLQLRFWSWVVLPSSRGAASHQANSRAIRRKALFWWRSPTSVANETTNATICRTSSLFMRLVAARNRTHTTLSTTHWMWWCRLMQTKLHRSSRSDSSTPPANSELKRRCLPCASTLMLTLMCRWTSRTKTQSNVS